MSTYRETFVAFADAETGETHRFSAYQVKTVRGNNQRTRITYRDEDQVVRFTVEMGEADVWQQLAAGMVEFV